MNKLKYVWEKVNASFWFIPLLFIFAGIFAAALGLYLDREINLSLSEEYNFLFSFNADSARSILSTISGAMIGVAGTVFSITLVALTLASSSFGSRLLRNFMYDKLNQVVLGTYLATFLYCLLILNAVHDGEDFHFIPEISVFVAILFAVFNIILLIVFIHHIAVSIQSDQIISNITKLLNTQIEKHLNREDELKMDAHFDLEKVKYNFCNGIPSEQPGYIQSINYKALRELAAESDILIRLDLRAGHFVTEGGLLCKIWSKNQLNPDLVLDINKTCIVGNQRSAIQDIEFMVHQLVEIACRALSPGINDPYTAIACIDNLTASLGKLSRMHFHSGHYFDEKQTLRLSSKELHFEGILDTAFHQIRQNGKQNPPILIRQMESLLTIVEMNENPDYRLALEKHAEVLHNTAKRNFEEPVDLADFKKIYNQFPKSKPSTK
ncbi:DUF2254 domain-containing protein [Marinilongibacter aquaticus]|uniref:DUF2254 domain-containing protein n=1 Tax=Marinilongibacter aquaticus TaxID=2975157 RepID=UPI0021BDBAE8|nr:DUF2254 domain-containing protein [Marinilongibacter aquaticus]UBM59714.1 DUF2254 domain-containing protein [Marinilongibacter aquaticus]